MDKRESGENLRLIGFFKIIWRLAALIRGMDAWWQYRQQTAVDQKGYVAMTFPSVSMNVSS